MIGIKIKDNSSIILEDSKSKKLITIFYNEYKNSLVNIVPYLTFNNVKIELSRKQKEYLYKKFTLLSYKIKNVDFNKICLSLKMSIKEDFTEGIKCPYPMVCYLNEESERFFVYLDRIYFGNYSKRSSCDFKKINYDQMTLETIIDLINCILLTNKYKPFLNMSICISQFKLKNTINQNDKNYLKSILVGIKNKAVINTNNIILDKIIVTGDGNSLRKNIEKHNDSIIYDDSKYLYTKKDINNNLLIIRKNINTIIN